MISFKYLIATTATAALLGMSSAAMAECIGQQAQTDAQQANEQIVANAQTDPKTGEKEAATGAAKPTENWFGCKPGSADYDKCVSAKGQEQKAEAKDEAKLDNEQGSTSSSTTGSTSSSTSDSTSSSTSGSSTVAKSETMASTSGDCADADKKG